MVRTAKWLVVAFALLVLAAPVRADEWIGEIVTDVKPDGTTVTVKKDNTVLHMTAETVITIPGQQNVTCKTMPQFLKPGDRVDAVGFKKDGKWICTSLKKK